MEYFAFGRRASSMLLGLCVLAGAGAFLCACNADAGPDLGAIRYAVTGTADKPGL